MRPGVAGPLAPTYAAGKSNLVMTNRNPLPDNLDTLLFTALLEKSADAIYFKDTEGRYLRVGNRIVGIFEQDHPTQVEGKTDKDFLPEAQAAEIETLEKQVLESGLPILDREESTTWPDGSVTWSSTSRFPLYDEEGCILGILGISRDITERKEAEARLAEAQHEIVEQAKKSAVAEFAGTVLALSGGSLVELREGIERTLAKLSKPDASLSVIQDAQEDLRELRHAVKKLGDLLKIQGP